jgi:hypothetical protein
MTVNKLEAYPSLERTCTSASLLSLPHLFGGSEKINQVNWLNASYIYRVFSLLRGHAVT